MTNETKTGDTWIDGDGRVWTACAEDHTGVQYRTERLQGGSFMVAVHVFVPPNWRRCWRNVTPAVGQVWFALNAASPHQFTLQSEMPAMNGWSGDSPATSYISTMWLTYPGNAVCLTPPAETPLRLVVGKVYEVRMDNDTWHLGKCVEICERASGISTARFWRTGTRDQQVAAMDAGWLGDFYELPIAGNVREMPNSVAPADSIQPPRCKYATLQETGRVRHADFHERFSIYVNAQEGMEQQRREQRQYAQRTIRAWPVCKVSGKPVEFREQHRAAAGVDAYGFFCPECCDE